MIYILGTPEETAQALDDTSLDKMIRMVAQVLCNVHHMLLQIKDVNEFGLSSNPNQDYKEHSKIPLKPKEGVINKWESWARECRANYDHLVYYGFILCEEYQFRFMLEIEKRSRFKKQLHSSKLLTEDDFKKAFAHKSDYYFCSGIHKKQLVIEWARNNVPDLPRQVCPKCSGCGHNGKAQDGRYYACENCKGHEDSLGEGYIDLMTPFPLVMPRKYYQNNKISIQPNIYGFKDEIIMAYRDYYLAKLKQRAIKMSYCGKDCYDLEYGLCSKCDWADSDNPMCEWTRREKPEWVNL